MLSSQEIASMITTVASALDISLPQARKSVASDGYGHSIETWGSVGTVQVNVIKPTASLLSAYADIIGSQRALLIRSMQTTDIREGDHLAYDGHTWLVQNCQNAESYAVTKEYLMTTIT